MIIMVKGSARIECTLYNYSLLGQISINLLMRQHCHPPLQIGFHFQLDRPLDEKPISQDWKKLKHLFIARREMNDLTKNKNIDGTISISSPNVSRKSSLMIYSHRLWLRVISLYHITSSGKYGFEQSASYRLAYEKPLRIMLKKSYRRATVNE